MKKGKAVFAIITLFVGVIIGMGTFVAFGVVLCYMEPDTLLDGPKIFGDVTISPEKPLDIEGIRENYEKVLVMGKDNRPFLMIFQNKSGECNELALFNEKSQPVLSLNSLD